MLLKVSSVSSTYPNSILELEDGPVFGYPPDLADEDARLKEKEVPFLGDVPEGDGEPVVREEASELVDAPAVSLDARSELVVLCPVGDTQHQFQGLLEIGVVLAKTRAIPYQLLEEKPMFFLIMFTK